VADPRKPEPPRHLVPGMKPPQGAEATRPTKIIPGAPAKSAPSKPEVTRPTKAIPSLFGNANEKTNPLIQPDVLAKEARESRRRDVERKKRQAAVEKLHRDEETQDSLIQFLKVTGVVVAVGLVAFFWRRVDAIYGDKWPMDHVWGVIALAFLFGFGWAIWYLNKADM